MTRPQLLKSRMNQRLLHKRRKQSLSPNLLSLNQILRPLSLKNRRRRKRRRKRSRSRKSSPNLLNQQSPSGPSLLRKLRRLRLSSLNPKQKCLQSRRHSLGRHWLKKRLSKLIPRQRSRHRPLKRTISCSSIRRRPHPRKNSSSLARLTSRPRLNRNLSTTSSESRRPRQSAKPQNVSAKNFRRNNWTPWLSTTSSSALRTYS